MTYKYKKLVLAGAGIRGIAYIGVLQVLENKGILKNINAVAGTSAGAIITLLLGLNYPVPEMINISKDINKTIFIDKRFEIKKKFKRLFNDFGWHNGNNFHKWLSNLVEKKTGDPYSTFKEIHLLKDRYNFIDPYFVATNLQTRREEIFSFEHTPEISIADAATMSMSIPLYFTPRKTKQDKIYVDGGLLNNFPIRIFDRQEYIQSANNSNNVSTTRVFNNETLGLRMTPKKIDIKINNIYSFIQSLVITAMENEENRHFNSGDCRRTIYIDALGVKPTEFNINEEKRQELIKSGYNSSEKFFKQIDDLDNKTILLRAETNKYSGYITRYFSSIQNCKCFDDISNYVNMILHKLVKNNDPVPSLKKS